MDKFGFGNRFIKNNALQDKNIFKSILYLTTKCNIYLQQNINHIILSRLYAVAIAWSEQNNKHLTLYCAPDPSAVVCTF